MIKIVLLGARFEDLSLRQASKMVILVRSQVEWYLALIFSLESWSCLIMDKNWVESVLRQIKTLRVQSVPKETQKLILSRLRGMMYLIGRRDDGSE